MKKELDIRINGRPTRLFCKSHWKKLADAARAKGMGEWVPETEELLDGVLYEVMKLPRLPKFTTPDPLRRAFFCITGVARDLGFLERRQKLISVNDKEITFCAICGCIDQGIPAEMPTEKFWIDVIMGEIFKHVTREGLLG